MSCFNAAIWFAVFVGCGGTPGNPREAAVSPVAHAKPAPPPPSKPPTRLARWSNIETVDNCFYFSGPFNGRDELLRGEASVQLDGARATLVLGRARFEGSIDGDTMVVSRTVLREHDGSWKTTETIFGTYQQGRLRGRYRYEECGPNEPCPGRCTMTADLVAD